MALSSAPRASASKQFRARLQHQQHLCLPAYCIRLHALDQKSSHFWTSISHCWTSLSHSWTSIINIYSAVQCQWLSRGVKGGCQRGVKGAGGVKRRFKGCQWVSKGDSRGVTGGVSKGVQGCPGVSKGCQGVSMAVDGCKRGGGFKGCQWVSYTNHCRALSSSNAS